MRWTELLNGGVLRGAAAGLVGGVTFGITMADLDRLPAFAELLRLDSAAIGFVVVAVVGSLLGAGFGVLVYYQRPGVGETLFGGLVYAVFWWYIGPLTLMPLLQGDGLRWDVSSAQMEFHLLIGHVLYGVVISLAFVLVQLRRYLNTGSLVFKGSILLRGGLAGLMGGGLLGIMLNQQDQLLTFAAMADSNSQSVAWSIVLSVGLVSGVVFSLLYPRPTDGAGAVLVRGMVYGFVWWVVGGLTLVPLLEGTGLTWTAERVRANFETFPAYLFFGAAVALLYQWLRTLVSLLFSDFVADTGQEGIGTQGLRIIGRSVLGGLVGGLLFSLIMLQTDFLPSVADLVGSTSRVAGFIVHLAIATTIGTSYGLLFRRQSYDTGSALGWGVSYGLFWSILGPLTLMPIFLGGSPQWTPQGVATAFPNLIGHLAYGAGLGITFYILEARYRPWWVPRTQIHATRIAYQKEQLLTSAPVLWTLLVAVGLTLPILLAS